MTTHFILEHNQQQGVAMTGKRGRESERLIYFESEARPLTPTQVSTEADRKHDELVGVAHSASIFECRNDLFGIINYLDTSEIKFLFKAHAKETLRAVCPQLPKEICDMIWEETGIEAVCTEIHYADWDLYTFLEGRCLCQGCSECEQDEDELRELSMAFSDAVDQLNYD